MIESPWAGNVAENFAYLQRCMRDCLRRGEFPLASALLYAHSGVLDDDKPAERALGIAAGLAWAERADETIVYLDHGISLGMRQGIAAAERAGRPVGYRWLDAGPTMPVEPKDMPRALAKLPCPACRGGGRSPWPEWKDCGTCHGYGFVERRIP